MATTQDTNESTAESGEEYEPNLNNLVEERAKNYLEHRDGMARAYEIASVVESTSEYTRRRCNALVDEGKLLKEYGGGIVGHPMPPNGDDIAVLEGDRETLLQIVETYGSAGQYQRALTIASIDELREFIKKNIAIGDGHGLGTRKVFFGPKSEEDPEE